jgi:hypothetical protein
MSDARDIRRSAFPPILIVAACAVIVAGAAIATYPLVDPGFRGAIVQAFGPSFIPFNIVFLVLGLAGAVGYWKMRRWGVYAYTAMVLISTPYNLALGFPLGIAYLTPVAICAIGWLYFGRME